MELRWIARPYRYADNVPWNADRYEIFVHVEGEWVAVGGAIRHWSNRTIAFLCTKTQQRLIRTPYDAEQRSNSLYVMGDTVTDALRTLKWKYPDPLKTLSETEALLAASF